MKCIHVILASALFGLAETALAQGFVNLDFEDTTIPPTPVNGFGGSVDPAMAFPGWTVGNLSLYTFVLYNNLTLGAPALDLMGPDFPNAVGYTPLQGSYSVLLYYDNPSIVPPPTLGQTGLVPANAQSISILLGAHRGDLDVAMNGVNIPMVSLPNGRIAGDISAFAGHTAQLTLSIGNELRGDSGAYFDDIQFSSSAIPEPSEFSFLTLGGGMFGFWRWRKSAR